jgi:hypothetical protein
MRTVIESLFSMAITLLSGNCHTARERRTRCTRLLARARATRQHAPHRRHHRARDFVGIQSSQPGERALQRLNTHLEKQLRGRAPHETVAMRERRDKPTEK